MGGDGYFAVEMQIAEKSDPRSPFIQSSLAWALLAAGRYEDAGGHCQKAAADTQCLVRVTLAQGRIGEAIQILGTRKTQYLGYAYG